MNRAGTLFGGSPSKAALMRSIIIKGVISLAAILTVFLMFRPPYRQVYFNRQ
jgi:hypothetical protein